MTTRLKAAPAAATIHTDCDISIRLATKDDLRPIHAIEKVIYKAEGPWSLQNFKDDFIEPGRYYLVAVCEGTIIGYAGSSIEGRMGEIMMLTVTPEHRRKGIAKKFLNMLIDWCADNGALEVMLQVRAGNTGPQDLYVATGFVANAPLADYYGPGIDAIEMVKTL